RGVMGALAGAAAGGFGGAKLGGKATGHSKTSAVVGALAGAFAGHKLQDAASDWKDDRDDKKEEEKRRKDEEKRRDDDHDRPHRRRNSRSRSRSSSRSSRSSHRRRDSRSRGGGRYAGHFTASSRDIDLDDRGDYNLRASCERHDGSHQSSTISLNHILENDNGSFRWSSGGGHGHSRPNTVTVQQGDTLRSIAANFGCSFEEIARHNGINNPDLIYPGQVLQVPGGGGSHGGGGGNFGSSARHVRLVDGGSKLEAELRRENGEWVRSSIVLDERIKNDNGTLRLI
ncbi:CVNH domain-containing protein, partial [Ilyonectria sp. MPI-CAGE-AT-0026]